MAHLLPVLLVPLMAMTGACGLSVNEDDAKQAKPGGVATVTVTASPGPDLSIGSAPEPSDSSLTLPPAIDGPRTDLPQVSTPSGNIRCAMEYGVECFINEAGFAPLPSPTDCDLDWIDHSFYIGESGGQRGVCRSDTPFTDESTALPYGATSIWRDTACQSTVGGMICWNTQTRHGFRLARADYDLF